MAHWDRAWLDRLNPDAPNAWLDPLMVLVTLLGYFLPFAVVGVMLWGRGRRWEAVAFWLALLLAEMVTQGFKGIIERPRPDDVRLLAYVGETFSMPSGHAARVFAALFAVWSSGTRLRWGLGPFAILTLVSRVYVGAHYPSDVLAGAVVGSLAGLLALTLVAAVRFELRLPADKRWFDPERILGFFRGLVGVDRNVRARLEGGHVAGDASLARWTRVWVVARVFAPLVPVALFFVAYPILFPELLTATLSCIAGYFFPFGPEWGVPLCIGFGLTWWQVVLIVAYLDFWLSLFMVLNLDYLYAVPWLGARMTRAQTKGMAFVKRHPWILKAQFFGVAAFVFLPFAGTGIITAVLIGRVIGMPRFLVWGAAMLGTLTNVTLLGLASAGVFSLL